MKVDNFVLLIISIVTLIVISLLTECNRGRLTELENKATKEIVETFFHVGSVDPTEPGQWGYQITGITQGKYGGRSRQQVINKLLEVGSHSEGDYISESEKQNYGSDLFDSTIDGQEIDPVDCIEPTLVESTLDNSFCETCINNKLVYKYIGYEPARYRGNCSINNIFKHTDNNFYRYIKETNNVKYLSSCGPAYIEQKVSSSNLLNITINSDYTITIDEPTWCGFFSSEEVAEKLFGNSTKFLPNNIVNTPDTFKLKFNEVDTTDLSNYNFLKYQKDNKFYTVTDNRGDFINTSPYTINNVTSNLYGDTVNSVFVSNISGIGDYLFTGGGDHRAQMYDVSTGRFVRSFDGGFGIGYNVAHTNQVTSVFVSQVDLGTGTKDYLFTGSHDQKVKMWDISSGALVRTFFMGDSNQIWDIFVSGNNLFTVGGYYDSSNQKNIKMWNINAVADADGVVTNPVKTFGRIGEFKEVRCVCVSGNKLFTGGGSKENTKHNAYMWNIDATASNGVVEDYQKTFSGHTGFVWSMCVSGNNLFTGSIDKTAKMWNISNGTEERTFTGHDYSVYSVFVSGGMLFTGSRDNTAKMWNISNGTEERTFSGHRDRVYSVFVSGGMLFTGSKDKSVKIWDISA